MGNPGLLRDSGPTKSRDMSGHVPLYGELSSATGESLGQGGIVPSRRLPIFVGFIDAALVVGTGLTSASASTKHPYPASLGTLQPERGGARPLASRSENRRGLSDLRTAGRRPQCRSRLAAPGRHPGHAVLGCLRNQEINLLSAAYAATRKRSPAAFRDLSVLGANIDLVGTGPNGQILRYWLRGDLSLTLVSICHHQALGACARLTAPVAHYMAARLTGQPVVTKVSSVFPPHQGDSAHWPRSGRCLSVRTG